MKINEQLRQARKSRGLTMKQVANHLGYSEAHICHIEKGNRKIRLEDFKALETFLDVKIDDIDGEPQFGVTKSKADKLYEIIKLVFATPDNYKKIEDIWNS